MKDLENYINPDVVQKLVAGKPINNVAEYGKLVSDVTQDYRHLIDNASEDMKRFHFASYHSLMIIINDYALSNSLF